MQDKTLELQQVINKVWGTCKDEILIYPTIGGK